VSIMDFEQLISRLALALGIGLLVGLERGWRTREDAAGSRAAGIRTFALTGLLGGVLGALGRALGEGGGAIAIGFGFAVYGAVMAVFCLEENRAEKTRSATTWVAAILTFALGVYAVIGDMRVAAALAVASTIILALREPIHGWVERLTWPELRSGLVLLAMSFIALPIVPDESIGPFGGFNPREVWIIAIVLAAASFVGYAAVKYLGASRGILLAGVAGALASSTAVTVANARRAAAGEAPERLLAAGVACASAVMFARIGLIVLAINASLSGFVLPPLLAAAAVAVAYALLATLWLDRTAGPAGQTKFRNPFAFWSVIGFALFLGALIIVGRAVGEWLGATGAIAGAAVIGFVDVDAITVSVARLVPDPLDARGASLGILAAAATGTAGKAAISAMLGSRRFALDVGVMAGACLLAGAAAAWAAFGPSAQ
jgi:uncharacterized membrane protein (DUF4010 family)